MVTDETENVFLVPVIDGQYQLYCEPSARDDEEAPEPEGKPSFWRRKVQEFRATLAEAEAERLRVDQDEPSDKGGIGRWVVRKIAEAIAEQRLLWHLRQATEALLTHPDDLSGDEALKIARGHLSADYRKHRNWCLIDGLLAAITGPLFFFVPGPNVIGWYFLFRAIGHLFALRGARQGLQGVRWQTVASTPLAGLRQVLGLAAPERRERVEAIGATLGLSHLVAFVERVAARPS